MVIYRWLITYNRRPCFSALPRFVIALSLLYSGLLHFQNQFMFFESVLRYNLLPIGVAHFVSIGITAASFVAGTSLILPNLQIAAPLFALTLFLIFTAAQLIAFCRGVQVGCGCFGISSEPIGWSSILFAMACVMFSIFCLFDDIHQCIESEDAK